MERRADRLKRATTLAGTEWIEASLTTFAVSVASFVPGEFEAYARLYHPWERGDGSADPHAPTWRELAAEAHVDLDDPVACMTLGSAPRDLWYVRFASLAPHAIHALAEHLRPATSTPERCFYALWEGFGDVDPPRAAEPMLELPFRRYHVFTAPLDEADASFSNLPETFTASHRSANLWWPADHAWCVASEVDHLWSYVGGSRAMIDALLADARLEAVETTADSRW